MAFNRPSNRKPLFFKLVSLQNQSYHNPSTFKFQAFHLFKVSVIVISFSISLSFLFNLL